MTTELEWFKSSYSSNDGPACVEAAISPSPQLTIHIRDSKTKDARLAFPAEVWADFLEFTAGR
ncbi:DUF397 domain-containing protein [Streptomyces luteogriseus]|uniref:DUF397 domain-containing protein n=1 Tax=Streptomyces luteogriseus TaxID=68233 RepID=A0A7W7DSA3_9ACTN|nr:DUF397 domain-containing protein [Streptomyces luteogriseus]MBB4714507.1 hypothetical protein [Streptomyces luteogriseus]